MIVDWLSYTLPVKKQANDMLARDELYRTLQEYLPEFFTWWNDDKIKPVSPRRPYCVAYSSHNCVAFTGVNIDHALVEASGKGCEELRQSGLLDTIISAQNAHFTRIDIALDILGVNPDDVIEAGYSDRFRTHSRIASDTGITHYVGSPKSERFVRVYRYAPPHPRSNLCRVEIVHRKRYARILIDAIRTHGLTDAALAALASYGFKHDKIPATSDAVLATVAISKGDQNTVRWLIAQVSPAFKRLVENGTISDPEDFLARYFLAR